MPRVDPAELRGFVTEVYLALGVPKYSAALVADSLVQADLWGHGSHGVLRTFWYAARLKSGAMKADANPAPDKPGAALTGMDGEGGLGQLAAQRGMAHAIEAARKHGIGAVAVRNSGHFGTAMYFTRMAAQAGCVGFLSTNASPAMAPWGGMEKRVGTNPWSWAAPAGRHPPMMLDIANTAVARGKLYLARERGEAIPEGWAIDADGHATTDPEAGIAGTILPMAGHKGYAIGALMDVISGILPGSGFGTAITGPYVAEGVSGVGHLALAIDIATLRPLAAFEADMERLIAELHGTPRAPGVERIWYPGEQEAECAVETALRGVPVSGLTAETLRKEAAEVGVAAPF